MINLSEAPLNQLHHIEGYRQYFTDATYWQPYIQVVSQKEGFSCMQIELGVPGCMPTFMLDRRWVIKFFGQLFDGPESFHVEKAINQVLTAEGNFPAPKLLGAGELFPESATWPWPYLIFEFWPQMSIGVLRDQVSEADKVRIAQEMGQLVRQLHDIPYPQSQAPLPSYADFLRHQYANCLKFQQEEDIIPAHLLAQLKDYLLPLDDLLQQAQPVHLIHADLTADHLFGEMVDGAWQTRGLIDFGDAMLGDLGYELIALYLDLFGRDKNLLAIFLKAYGVEETFMKNFAHKMMTLTLLHRFNVLEPLFEPSAEVASIQSWETLAEQLWQL